MPVPGDDKKLAEAFAARERWAFDEAFRRYASLLYSAAYNVLRNPDDAQDCVSDAVARLWRKPQAYSPARGSLRSFLVVCVRNAAISRRRQEVRRARSEERLAAMPSERQEFRFPDPIERDRVRNGLLALPVEQRTALELAYYGGKTQTEIAAELGEPLGTIKSRIKLGLRRLASILEPLSITQSDGR
jgi:RNA polymerase sigma-70 factor, ECF subfamily